MELTRVAVAGGFGSLPCGLLCRVLTTGSWLPGASNPRAGNTPSVEATVTFVTECRKGQTITSAVFCCHTAQAWFSMEGVYTWMATPRSRGLGGHPGGCLSHLPWDSTTPVFLGRVFSSPFCPSALAGITPPLPRRGSRAWQMSPAWTASLFHPVATVTGL